MPAAVPGTARAQGHAGLQTRDHHRSQDDRDHVPRRVLRPALHRRADGAVDPRRTRSARSAAFVQRAVQPAVHHPARHGDAAARRHPDRLRVRKRELPLRIGAPDVAFPGLDALAFWLLVFGAASVLAGFITRGAPRTSAWTAYAGLSDAIHSPGAGGDLWIMGLAVAGLGTILGGANLITTVICMPDPSSAMATKYSSWARRINALEQTSYLPMSIGVN